jgi:hypothetical protein
VTITPSRSPFLLLDRGTAETAAVYCEETVGGSITVCDVKPVRNCFDSQSRFVVPSSWSSFPSVGFEVLTAVTMKSFIFCDITPMYVSRGVERQRREADHLPSSVAEVKNGGDMPPLVYTSSWLGA